MHACPYMYNMYNNTRTYSILPFTTVREQLCPPTPIVKRYFTVETVVHFHLLDTSLQTSSSRWREHAGLSLSLNSGLQYKSEVYLDNNVDDYTIKPEINKDSDTPTTLDRQLVLQGSASVNENELNSQ